MRTLVWFRGKELRVDDHAPLARALEHGGEVIPLFVVDPYFFDPERARAIPHRIQFLLDSLHALAARIESLGSRLIVVHGRSVDLVPELAHAWKVDRVVSQRWTEPVGRERDRRIAAALRVPFELLDGETLATPGQLSTQAGGGFAVYSAYARAFERDVTVGKPLAAPRSLPPIPHGILAREKLPTCESLGIARNDRVLPGGEREAHARLAAFVRGPAKRYAEDRDRLDRDATSRLSVDLKFGTISPRVVWHATSRYAKFRAEILWREFAYHILWNEPEVLKKNFRGRWAPHGYDERRWRAWVDGTTGYPIVDAAARQLLAEGFVPNRARMVSASFLVKHLQIDFRRGEAHYLAWLTDGDWANNDLNWQWCAGCGADAQPYERVFNPILQGERFDPDGTYVRRWIPELANADPKTIHQPVHSYAKPIVDHAEARARYLAMVATHRKR